MFYAPTHHYWGVYTIRRPIPRYCNRWEKTIFPTYVTKYAVIIRVGAKRACLCGNFLTQRIDTLRNSSEDDGQVWEDILSGLGYDELQLPPSWQSCYKKMTELIRANVPYFAEYGQKYYNTLRIQALTPADSISELFDIIYSFYRNNLECQYNNTDNAFEILTENIQKRLSNDANNDDAQISFGSGFWRLKSSLKFLLSHEPIYMAAVCDAIAGKMDMLLRGDTPAINKNNRWDVLLQEWFNKKTATEKSRCKM